MNFFEILHIFLILITFGLSSLTCSISESFSGIWIQPGLTDLITINNTWFSLKGICLNGPQDAKNKYIYYNEQTRCKRCILFIPRHINALQYRESECFDADDENSRICGSITPDTVLYTLFRNNAESISCPFDQSWYFKKTHHNCQPIAFENCFVKDTYQILYNNHCQSNQGITAKCFAQFSDGNMNYVISKSINQQRFICFSYGRNLLSNEVHLSQDDTCRDILTRESALTLNILPNKSFNQSIFDIPDWTQGTWLSIGTDDLTTKTFFINKSQVIIKLNHNQIIRQDLKFVHIKYNKRNIRIRAKSLEQCSAVFYCIKLVYRSSAVIDLSIGIDEHGCKDNHIHYTLFKSEPISAIPCPQIGIYKSLNNYHTSLSVSSCSTGPWSLSIGCESSNISEITFSSSCRHDVIPEVQVITSIKGICLASWRIDQRFQRTLILYEKAKAFCLIQPLKLQTASWILSEFSCSNLDLPSIHVENSLRYFDNCQQTSSSSHHRIYSLLFYIIMQILIK